MSHQQAFPHPRGSDLLTDAHRVRQPDLPEQTGRVVFYGSGRSGYYCDKPLPLGGEHPQHADQVDNDTDDADTSTGASSAAYQRMGIEYVLVSPGRVPVGPPARGGYPAAGSTDLTCARSRPSSRPTASVVYALRDALSSAQPDSHYHQDPESASGLSETPTGVGGSCPPTPKKKTLCGLADDVAGRSRATSRQTCAYEPRDACRRNPRRAMTAIGTGKKNKTKRIVMRELRRTPPFDGAHSVRKPKALARRHHGALSDPRDRLQCRHPAANGAAARARRKRAHALRSQVAAGTLPVFGKPGMGPEAHEPPAYYILASPGLLATRAMGEPTGHPRRALPLLAARPRPDHLRLHGGGRPLRRPTARRSQPPRSSPSCRCRSTSPPPSATTASSTSSLP